jgi:cytochrome P450
MSVESMNHQANFAAVPLPPVAPGLPILGNALEMGGDQMAFLVRMYHQLGPIFRIRALTREFTVLGGIEANRFMAKSADDYLSGAQLFGGLNTELRSRIVFPALDGEQHNYYRKLFRPSYSREAVTPHYGKLIELTRDHVRGWKLGEALRVVPTMQQVITDQLGMALAGVVSGDYFPDLRDVLRTLIMVKLMKSAPEWTLKLPAYKRKKQRAVEFMRGILESHRNIPPEQRRGDLIDQVITSLDEDGRPFTEDDLEAMGFGAFFVGMDTAGHTTSFALYALLKHPEVLARVIAEVDEVWGRGVPTPQDLRNMKALHGAIVETTRMYPVAPIMPRNATETFTFGGYRVDKGASVMMVTALTHYLPEYYPNPERFDIDRDDPGEAFVYAPFGLGAHTCLGAGLADVLLMLTVGTLLYNATFELVPADFEMKLVGIPVPNPGQNFMIKPVALRH